MSSNKTLLEVTVFEFTGEEIAKIKSMNKRLSIVETILPEFVLYNGHIGDSDLIYQFYTNPEHLDEKDKNKKVIMFDARAVSNLLEHEFSEMGKNQIFNDYIEKDLIEVLTKYAYKNDYESFGRSMPTESFIVIDIIYESSYDYWSGATEGEIYIELDGFLDQNMMFVPIGEIRSETTHNNKESKPISLM